MTVQAKSNLGLSDSDRELLEKELHVIINCAGTTEFNARLDQAMRINVTGALQLLKLAEACGDRFLCLAHISTCYAVCDHQGVIEESLVASHVNWEMDYEQIRGMNNLDIDKYASTLIGKFPNVYTYTKRMAEHLLNQRNLRRVPLLILRPSIIGASLEEPFPGWTDSITLAGGIYLIGGMGILRDLPGDENVIGDQIPVDLVSNQLLGHIPMAVHNYRTTGEALLVTHASSSQVNPLRWKETIQYLTSYFHRSPIVSRAFNPSITFYNNKKVYKVRVPTLTQA